MDMIRQAVILQGTDELIVVHRDPASGKTRNVTVKDPSLVADFVTHRSQEVQIKARHHSAVQAADDGFQAGAQAAEAEYKARADALKSGFDTAVQQYTQARDEQLAALVPAKNTLDARAFAAAESIANDQQ